MVDERVRDEGQSTVSLVEVVRCCSVYIAIQGLCRFCVSELPLGFTDTNNYHLLCLLVYYLQVGH